MTENTKRALMVGPSNLWNMKRDFQIKFLKEMGMKPNHSLMDMGCGVLRGGIPIIDYLDAGKYYGFEVRNYVLEEGKEELRESGLEYKNPHLWSESSINVLKTDIQFDFMWAFSVLIHMTDEIVSECLTFAGYHLNDNGKFYANVSIGEHKENEWLEFPVIRRSLNDYSKLAEKSDLVVTSIGQLENLGHNSGKPAQDAHHMLKFEKI